ncbi:cbb3-type cytochrome c oxidase subunit II [Luteolibacter sp. Populi]|uniref:cbb3-type cytochrome c oxidase subunit II n=1 Tax=Luteolibacter sp. Populi TaxID=3230487 RepID=UPI0034671FB5
MSFRQFAFGLTASFGIAWLAVVIVPFFMMRHLKPVEFKEAADGKEGIYFPKSAGRVTNGAEVYAANGCAHCHSQLIRPVYAGNDLGRPDWAGLKNDEERGDTRRQSNIFDYQGEKFAQIGLSRLGPDLSNVGRRVEKIYCKDGGDPKSWLLSHLYNPRANPKLVTSKCPSFPFFFETKEIEGQVPANAITVKDGEAVVPGPEALVLVDYLLSLKRDDAVPASMNHLPPVPKGAPKPAAPAAAAPQG